MLPSRTRLERWNPDSLTFTARSVKDSGDAVDNAVSSISTNIKTMPETKAWSGDAHDAASSMFGRAEDKTADFSAYTTEISAALDKGAGTIGAARTPLLNKADAIDMSGELYVSNEWVVLITGAEMTAEQAAQLEKRAQAEQATVNGLLLAVGAADDETAANVTAAARSHGFEMPKLTSLEDMYAGAPSRPADEVPNPSNPVGVVQQGMLRDVDMGQTVRATTVETSHHPDTGELLSTTTTVYMQDGSKHVRKVDAKSTFPDRSPAITETVIDKHGEPVLETTSVTFEPGVIDGSTEKVYNTTVKFANGTVVSAIEHANGNSRIIVHVPHRREADVPLEILNHPILSTASAGFSGLEAQAGRGIPMISAEASDYVRAGAKYAGPGISFAAAMWDVAVAETGFQKCVATAEGLTSVGGGALGGFIGSGGGPLGAFAGSLLLSSGGQALGNWVGNTFCPR